MKSINKMKYTLMIAIVLTLMLSACGAKATPTPDIMATANAAASTMIAETQAAMPSDTPAPTPTDTSQPSPTIPPLPTTPLIIASPTVPPVSGNCENQPITRSKGDKAANILIKNKTPVTLGFNLYLTPNSFGDCGNWYAADGIPPNGSLLVTGVLPLGCYYANAWTLSGKPDFKNFGYPFCVTITDRFTIIATVTTISFSPY